MSEKPAKSFFDTWQTYRKVVAANYMYHIEIMADIERILRTQFAAGRFSFLDLGCGDAATLAPLLERMALQSYKGVDLSQAALALAADNLKALTCPVELVERDILAALQTDATEYDVIYSSFALHHLSTSDKAAFFRFVSQRLKDGGIFVLSDVMREAGESLPVYLHNYCDWLRSGWSTLDAEELAAICDHIQNNDQPETLSELQTLAQAAGFSDAATVARYRWHHVVRFQAPS
jgi:SAM-dependent methyltransferase